MISPPRVDLREKARMPRFGRAGMKAKKAFSFEEAPCRGHGLLHPQVDEVDAIRALSGR